jgi:hypothetical protein
MSYKDEILHKKCLGDIFKGKCKLLFIILLKNNAMLINESKKNQKIKCNFLFTLFHFH